MALFLTAVLFFIILLVIFRIYLKLITGWDRSYTCLLGKTAVVTGANTGIGYYTALNFAKRGARVILACRDGVKAEEARQKIVLISGNQNVIVKITDMSSLKSVRQFAEEINSTEDRLDILVNNAGVGGLEDKLSEDGLQTTMQVNYFGPFLLTNLLLGLLKKSAPSRIVNVSSIMSKYLVKLNPDNLNEYPVGFMSGTSIYSNTKLCNVLFTNELARRLKGSGVTTNSLHPGSVYTEIFRRLPEPAKTVFHYVATCFFKTPEEGAQTTVYLSVSDEVKNVSGEYFSDCKKDDMAAAAKDGALAKKVWEESERLVQLNFDKKQ